MALRRSRPVMVDQAGRRPSEQVEQANGPVGQRSLRASASAIARDRDRQRRGARQRKARSVCSVTRSR